jgi:hypothetical protein
MTDDDDFDDDDEPQTWPEPQSEEEHLAQLDESLKDFMRLEANRRAVFGLPDPRGGDSAASEPRHARPQPLAPDLGRAPLENATFAPPPQAAIRPAGTTEDLLNGIIAELHFLMREVALPSALGMDESERRRFLGSAMDLATTGAKVGKTIAKLRSSSRVVEMRQRHYVERVERLLPPPTPLPEKA